MSHTQKRTAALISNILLVVLEIWAFIIEFRARKWGMFIYYTINSNVFTLLVSALFSVFVIKSMKTGVEIPRFVKILRFISSCCLFLTFTIVVVCLAPQNHSYGNLAGSYMHYMVNESSIFMHTLCPLLAVFSMIFFESAGLKTFTWSLFSLVPTLVYAAVSFALNILKIWTGPYFFLHVYEQSVLMSAVWFLIVMLVNFLLNSLLFGLNKKCSG